MSAWERFVKIMIIPIALIVGIFVGVFLPRILSSGPIDRELIPAHYPFNSFHNLIIGTILLFAVAVFSMVIYFTNCLTFNFCKPFWKNFDTIVVCEPDIYDLIMVRCCLLHIAGKCTYAGINNVPRICYVSYPCRMGYLDCYVAHGN